MTGPLLEITAVPDGEAPVWVREKWVGLALPFTTVHAAPRTYLTSGVLSGPEGLLSRVLALLGGHRTRRSGCLVEARAAVEVLALSNREAAAWWRENASHQLAPRRYFVFPQEVCKVCSPAPAA